MIRFRMLGSLEIQSPDGYLEPRGLRAILLITLLADQGRPVSDARLTAELWGDTGTGRPDNRLHAIVSRLRNELQQLEPGRSRPRLRRYRHSGYQLEVAPGELDAREFADGLELLEGQLGSAAPHLIAARARELLELWRGPVFGGAVGGSVCQEAARRYEHARLRVLEILFDMELENGRHADILPDLTELAVMSSAYQGLFCEQAMIALYRSGRHADAVSLYHHVRDDLSRMSAEAAGRLRQCNRAIQAHAALLSRPAPRDALARAS